MSLEVDPVFGPAKYGDRFIVAKKVDFDNSYAIGGEALTYGQLGFSRAPDFVRTVPQGRYVFEYDRTNKKLIARWNKLGVAESTIAVKHDASAASNGVAVYVHVDEVIEQGNTILCHLEAVNAGNADSYFRVSSGGAVCTIQDDDAAATAGVAIHFDENATAGTRFTCDLDRITGTDTSANVVVRLSDGTYLRIEDQDNPTGESGTVLVYFDDDAANDYERLLFVSPTTTNGTDRLWTDGGEVPNGTDLSAVDDVIVEAIGLL